MNSLLIAMVGLILFTLGYRFYARFIEKKVWQLDPGKSTPAVTNYDGLDYVPASHWTVLFGHHFSSIAAAGLFFQPFSGSPLFWSWLFLPRSQLRPWLKSQGLLFCSFTHLLLQSPQSTFCSNRGIIYTLIPAIFMTITTIAALIYQMIGFYQTNNYLLFVVATVLLVLAGEMLREASKALRH